MSASEKWQPLAVHAVMYGLYPLIRVVTLAKSLSIEEATALRIYSVEREGAHSGRLVNKFP